VTRPAARSELVGGDPVTLVTISWGGRDYRFSDVAVDIDTADGDVVSYEGGLEAIAIDESIDALAIEPEFPSVPVSVIFPIDVAEKIEQGQDLASATAEVAVHVVGQNYDDRERIVEGQLVEPEYGAANEPVSFSVEGPSLVDTGLTHKATEVASDDTWSDPESGTPYYPRVFGRPGAYLKPDGSENVIAGAPAIAVEETAGNVDTLVISKGWSVDSPTGITIFDGTTTESGFTPVNGLDSLNQKVTKVDISGAGVIDRTSGTSYQTLFAGSDSGGILADDGETLLDGAGDWIEHLMRDSVVEHDRGAFQALKPRLNLYKVGGYINAAVSPWDWLQEHLFPLLPLSIHPGPDGAMPILWPLQATETDAVGWIEEGDGATRVSPVTYIQDRGSIIDELRLSFARGIDGDRDIFGGSVAVGLSPDIDDTSASLYALSVDAPAAHRTTSKVSPKDVRKATKPIRTESLTTDIVYDRPTAIRIASEQLTAKASIVREVSYECDRTHRYLKKGAVVLLTDSDISLTSKVAIVTGRSPLSSGNIVLTLQLWTIPTRDLFIAA